MIKVGYDNTLLFARYLMQNFITYTKFRAVRSTARHAVHLQFDISANAFEIRALQSLKCII
jgi:hypothetical protein